MNTNGERGRFDTHRNAPAPLSTWYTPFLQRAFAPKSIISPKPFSLPKTRSNLPKHPIAVGNTGPPSPYFAALNTGFCALFRCAQYGLLLRYCPHSGAMRSAAPAMCSGYALARIRLRNPPVLPLPIRAFVALFRCAQYGLLSPYFAALNTGSCYAIAPTRGQCAPPLRLCARRSAACAHTPTQPARIAVGNTGFHRPISLRLIRAFVALFRCAQYGLLLRYCPSRGNALRRSGYVLAAPPLARIRLRNPPVLPLAIRASIALFRCA